MSWTSIQCFSFQITMSGCSSITAMWTGKVFCWPGRSARMLDLFRWVAMKVLIRDRTESCLLLNLWRTRASSHLLRMYVFEGLCGETAELALSRGLTSVPEGKVCIGWKSECQWQHCKQTSSLCQGGKRRPQSSMRGHNPCRKLYPEC